MNSRDLILQRIRAAVAGAPDPAVVRDYRVAGEPPAEPPIDLFAERVRDYRAIVHVVPADGLAATVATALTGRAKVIVPPGLPEDWLAATSGLEPVTDDPPAAIADLDAADGVISGCAVAVAETGTIVLDAGPAQGRRALTLVPDYHLCVVRADQIVPTVPDAIARLSPAAPLTWISGPSATSDIELDRVEGVHGPRTLEVVIVT